MGHLRLPLARSWQFATALALVGLSASTAFAHPGHGLDGLLPGLIHPMGGLDHLLAAFGVGWCAHHSTGKGAYRSPLGFLVAMTAGYWLASRGFIVPFCEQGISFSLLALGLLIAVERPSASWKWIAPIAGAGLFHGAAHGSEIAKSSGGVAVLVGLLISTAVLQALGLIVFRRAHRSVERTTFRWTARAMGAAWAGTALIFWGGSH